MMARIFRRGVITLSFAALVLLIVLGIGCAMRGEMEDSGPAMSLSSGVDKKSAKVNFADEGGGYTSNHYDSEYSTQSRGTAGGAGGSPITEMELPSEPGWNQPTAPGTTSPSTDPVDTDGTSAGSSGNNVISRALASAGIDEDRIDGWVFPKAYAADHGSDEQYLVRTGEVHMEVDSYEDAQTDVGAIANKYGGYVSNSNSQRYSDERIEGWIMVRVPADKFFEAWEEIRELGDIGQEKISTEDVSRQFLANHSEIKNLLAQQSTLQEMLNEAVEIQRKHGLGEGRSLLLDVQERLFDVTSQLQAVEDRQNALSDRISKSTITAHLSEVKEAQEVVEQVKEEWNWGTDKTFKDAYLTLLNKLRNIWHGIIWFVFTGWTWILPWVFWILVGIFCYRKWVRPSLIRSAQRAAAERDAAAVTEPGQDAGQPDEGPGDDE